MSAIQHYPLSGQPGNHRCLQRRLCVVNLQIERRLVVDDDQQDIRSSLFAGSLTYRKRNAHDADKGNNNMSYVSVRERLRQKRADSGPAELATETEQRCLLRRENWHITTVETDSGTQAGTQCTAGNTLWPTVRWPHNPRVLRQRVNC